jgi:EAL and modified HD-GYP domain-containing signal transduction protein
MLDVTVHQERNCMAAAALNMHVEEMDVQDFFLARQPILNIEQELMGYELLFRSTATDHATVVDDMGATAAVIAHAVELGLHNVIGTLAAFVNVDAEILMNDVIFMLPKDLVILEILETVDLTPALMKRIAMLAGSGYVFAIDDVVEESYRTELLLPYIGIVKIDVLATPAARMEALTRSFRLKGKKLLAEKIESIEMFRQCRMYGFDYYQGYYFAKPDLLRGRKLKASSVLLMQILALVMKGANNYEIVRFIKQDVALSLSLLRLVNTPLCGFRRHIASLGQALMVLGERQLKRWLQILLYANPEVGPGAVSSPLMVLAATRGKMCELLTQKIHPRRSSKSDSAFTVGVLSLADALFNTEMAEVIRQIGVSNDIQQALLTRTGFYGQLLQLVEGSEQPQRFNARALGDILASLQLSAEEFYAVQKEAFEWAGSISENMRFDPAN